MDWTIPQMKLSGLAGKGGFPLPIKIHMDTATEPSRSHISINFMFKQMFYDLQGIARDKYAREAIQTVSRLPAIPFCFLTSDKAQTLTECNSSVFSSFPADISQNTHLCFSSVLIFRCPIVFTSRLLVGLSAQGR